MDGMINTDRVDETSARDPWETISALQEAVTRLQDQVQALMSGGVERRQSDLAAKVGGLSQSLEIDQLATALAAAQAELHNPSLNRVARVELKSGGSYQHRFADLPEILATVRPVLGKHGLSFIQAATVIGNGTFLITRLMHSSGQWLQTVLPLPPLGSGRIQDWGGAITFTKRYALSALIGVAGGEDDDDGNAWDNNVAQIHDSRRGAAPTAMPLPQQRGESAWQRKASDAVVDATARGEFPSSDSKPSPDARSRSSGGMDATAQKALRELSGQLRACVDAETGDVDYKKAAALWLGVSDHIRKAPQYTIDALVDRYRTIIGGNPPAIDGVKYPPVGDDNG